MTPRYLTPAQVAEMLAVSKPTVMKLARAKDRPLPSVQLGKRVFRFELGAVEAWLASSEKKAG